MRALVYRSTIGMRGGVRGLGPGPHDVFRFIVPERNNLLISCDPSYGQGKLVTNDNCDLSTDTYSELLGEVDIPDTLVEEATAQLLADRTLQARKGALGSLLPKPPPAKFKTGDICQVMQVHPDARFRYSREEAVRVGTEVRIASVYTGSSGDPWVPWQRVYEYRAVRLKGAPVREGKPMSERFGEDELALLEPAK